MANIFIRNCYVRVFSARVGRCSEVDERGLYKQLYIFISYFGGSLTCKGEKSWWAFMVLLPHCMQPVVGYTFCVCS